MNLFIDYKLNTSGKGNFLRKLIPELEGLGVSVRFKPRGADVALAISKILTKTKLPTVLRVDGIHLSGKNVKIYKSMKDSKAIIYQSEFAKSFIHSRMRVPKRKEFVVYNGASPNDYKPAKVRRGSLMAAHWGNRKHKRLDRHFRYAMERPNERFYIAGKIPINPLKNMVPLGELSQKELAKYQSECKTFVYLADIDWCPNVVVEAITAGMEIVHDPKCEAVKELCSADKNDLAIGNVAANYKRVFGWAASH